MQPIPPPPTPPKKNHILLETSISFVPTDFSAKNETFLAGGGEGGGPQYHLVIALQFT